MPNLTSLAEHKVNELFFGHSSPFVHVLLISIQLQTDTKTIPILLFIKYRNWYILSIRLQKLWTKDEFWFTTYPWFRKGCEESDKIQKYLKYECIP